MWQYTTARVDAPVVGAPVGAVAVIELGVDRGAAPDDEVRRPAPRSHWVIFAMVVLVLLSVAAAAPPASWALRPGLRIPLTTGDTFGVSGDVLLVARRPPTASGLQAYALDSGRPLWQAAVAPLTSYGVRRSGNSLFVGERIYRSGQPRLSGQTRTAVMTADSGVPRWWHRGRIVAVDGSAVVAGVTDIPSIFGTGRRISGAVTGLDLHTGRVLWWMPLPATAVLQAPAPDRLLLVHDTGRMELLDLSDGRVLTAAQLPPAAYEPDNPGLVGGVLLLRHPVRGGSAVSAYDPGSLVRRWTRPEPSALDTVGACGPFVCLAGSSGVQAVHPGDGSPRWARAEWRATEQRAGHLLTYRSGDTAAGLVALADPHTGAALVDLRGWRAVPGPGDADLLLSRADTDGRLHVAVADPQTRRVRLLGALVSGTGDCRAGRGHLVCRAADGAVVGWAYG